MKKKTARNKNKLKTHKKSLSLHKKSKRKPFDKLRARKIKKEIKTKTEESNSDSLFDSSTGKTDSLFVANIKQIP